jgi:hypothetical protein
MRSLATTSGDQFIMLLQMCADFLTFFALMVGR